MMAATSKVYSVLVITDGSTDIGAGHIKRSLALNERLNEYKGIRTSFIVGPKSDLEFAQSQLGPVQMLASVENGKDNARQVKEIVNNENISLVLTDTYQLDTEFYKTMRVEIPTTPVIVVDDFGEKADYPVSGYISFGLSADKSLYRRELLNLSAVGPKFFPLRSEFLDISPKKLSRTKIVKRVIVTMGGSDPEGQTFRVARALKNFPQLESIDLLLGPLYGDTDKLFALTNDDPRFVINHSSQKISLLMAQADLAITGCGTTCNELAYLGIPMGALILAENQKLMATAMENYGCGRVLGCFKQITDEELTAEIKLLIDDIDSLAMMAEKGKKIIDGKGSWRLAKFIINFLRDYHEDKYKNTGLLKEYESSASEPQEHNKVKWGSREGMLNRFRLAINVIDWKKVDSWVDVGCGTGGLLREVEKSNPVESFLGLDLSLSLLRYAKNQSYKTRYIDFRCQSFMNDIPEGPFDLVTSIGVLQKCGVSLRKSVARLAELVKPGGQTFVTTKNLNWKKFNDPGFDPYPGHHWFTLEEIHTAFSLAGLKIVKLKGFEPRKLVVTEQPEDSHSVYVLATKEL